MGTGKALIRTLAALVGVSVWLVGSADWAVQGLLCVALGVNLQAAAANKSVGGTRPTRACDGAVQGQLGDSDVAPVARSALSIPFSPPPGSSPFFYQDCRRDGEQQRGAPAWQRSC